jgi:5-methylcytosine-specific restriction protein A
MPYQPPRVTVARPRRLVVRGRGRPLQRARRRLFDEAPLCVTCLAEGHVTIATIRDHVIPLADGGRDVDANTQGLCFACHDRKSAAETRRRLASGGASGV